MVEKEKCNFPDCPTFQLNDSVTKSLADIATRLSVFQVFENDISYIREKIDSIERRLEKEIDGLFERMRIVEQEKVSKVELFASVAATGTIVGVIFYIVQLATKH